MKVSALALLTLSSALSVACGASPAKPLTPAAVAIVAPKAPLVADEPEATDDEALADSSASKARRAAVDEAAASGVLGLLGEGSAGAPSDDEHNAAIIQALMNQTDDATLLSGIVGLGGLRGGGAVGSAIGGAVGGGAVVSSGLVMRGGGVGQGARGGLGGAVGAADPGGLGASSMLEMQGKTSGKKPAAPTRITLLSLKTEGLTLDATSRVFDRNDRAIRACYETWLETVKQAEGSLGLEIVVAKDGHVTKVGVTKPTGHTPLDICVLDVVTRLSFAKPTPTEGKDTIVSVELAFRRPPVATQPTSNGP